MPRSLALLLALLVPSAVLADGPFAPDAKVEKLAGDFKFTEGCASDPDGNVYFTDQPTDRILKWSVDGKLSTFLEKSGRSNGLCVDGGKLWACADEKNELWKIDLGTTKAEVAVKDFQGKRLNGPNDIWVTPAGGAYFTDPLYSRPYWPKEKVEREKKGVYFLSPKGELTRVADGFTQPNGIIGTPDGKTLYVADASGGKTFRFAVQPDGTLVKDEKPFCERGSDGMTIDSDGNVYLTSGSVWVYDKTGKQVAQLKVPEGPSNVCFGGKDKKTLFITARTGLYSVRCTTSGVGSQ